MDKMDVQITLRWAARLTQLCVHLWKMNWVKLSSQTVKLPGQIVGSNQQPVKSSNRHIVKPIFKPIAPAGQSGTAIRVNFLTWIIWNVFFVSYSGGLFPWIKWLTGKHNFTVQNFTFFKCMDRGPVGAYWVIGDPICELAGNNGLSYTL